MTPRLSICIPTYNRALCLKETIVGFLKQSYQDYEIIIGNDASEDTTSEIVSSFKDKRIRYYEHTRNLGIYSNWNYLIDLAQGEYVSIYHDHDIYLPSILERSVDVLDRNADVVFVHSAFILINKDKDPLDVFIEDFNEMISGRTLREYFVSSGKNTICAATVMARNKAYSTVGPFNANYGLGSDKDMWLRLASLGNVGYIREPQALILGRSEGDATSRFNIADYWGSLRLLQRALGELYSLESREYKKALRKLRVEFEMEMLKVMIKASFHEDSSEVNRRMGAVQAHCEPLTKTLISAMTKSALMRSMVGNIGNSFLRHVQKSRRRRAEIYCRKHSELLDSTSLCRAGSTRGTS